MTDQHQHPDGCACPPGESTAVDHQKRILNALHNLGVFVDAATMDDDKGLTLTITEYGALDTLADILERALKTEAEVRSALLHLIFGLKPDRPPLTEDEKAELRALALKVEAEQAEAAREVAIPPTRPAQAAQLAEESGLLEVLEMLAGTEADTTPGETT